MCCCLVSLHFLCAFLSSQSPSNSSEAWESDCQTAAKDKLSAKNKAFSADWVFRRAREATGCIAVAPLAEGRSGHFCEG